MTRTAPIDPPFWSDRSVLLTGHTGFKGAWLSLWLQSLGARVTGLAPAMPPTAPSLYALAGVGPHMTSELAIDVRDAPAVLDAVRSTRPDVILHLAAQPMVRLSLRDPALTFEVNVLGVVNILEAVRLAGDSVQAVVIVTSDKCYANPSGYPRAPAGLSAEPAGGLRRFVETDPLGGHDPYSSSKACAELVTAAYRESLFAPGAEPGSPGARARIASARAGNVIGGGDFGEDRLVPDILRAYDAGRPVRLRNPEAIRPWQHVLGPLSGYLALARSLCGPDARECARAFNFGPRPEDARTVLEIVRRLNGLLAGGLGHELDGAVNPPEAARLELDSTAAEHKLGWRPRWDLDEALARVAAWHEAYRRGADMRRTSLEQIAAFH
ncbi:MAG TPA: CDP-glucose 4,6-dehydratase [Solirubrobacteraceae bacterium]|nr:CDP-glucose 4,6-dehydratase [Solirubrobacteraceae bacterium]